MKTNTILIIVIILMVLLGVIYWDSLKESLNNYVPVNGNNNNNNNLPGTVIGTTLDLSGKNLSSFDVSSVSNKNQVKILNLSNNNFKSLPSQIGEFVNLEELYLDNNLLEGAIVAEIRKMTHLRILSAKNNNLSNIPAEIGQLSNLISLDLSNNNIDTMPNEIQNIKNNLKTLNLSGNNYSEEKIQEIKSVLPNTNVIY
jgi:Leucine-rich repeat (LRR) protein